MTESLWVVLMVFLGYVAGFVDGRTAERDLQRRYHAEMFEMDRRRDER